MLLLSHPVYFFMSSTDLFYGHMWTPEKEETLIWLQLPVPLQTTSSQSQLLFPWGSLSAIEILASFDYPSLGPSSCFWMTSSSNPSTFWWTSLIFCTVVLHQLQLFWWPPLCLISLLSHHHITWYPPRINLRLVSHLFLPTYSFQCHLLLFSSSHFTLHLWSRNGAPATCLLSWMPCAPPGP